MKRALVIRLGAIGDMIVITPVLPVLKQDGYKVIMQTNKRGKRLVLHNPYIDEWLYHDESMPADAKLWQYWAELSKNYDKTINYTHSIEVAFAKKVNYVGPKFLLEKRNNECNINFYDFALTMAGYPHIQGRRGEIYFSKVEKRFARKIRDNYKNKFLIVWVMAGSAWHKIYPYSELVAQMFMEKYGDNTQIVTIGDEIIKLIEFMSVPNVLKTRTAAVIEQADLIIGPDTGAMHIAGCFNVPKILLCTAHTPENLSKHWLNCINLEPENCYCHPCHRMATQPDECPADEDYKVDNMLGVRMPICITRIKPHRVLNAMETVYQNWLRGKRCTNSQEETNGLQKPKMAESFV
jgi:ADP-heptose:LPS heptosyltransferase